MTESGHAPSTQITFQDIGLVLLGFALYWLMYQFHELLIPYVSYAQGVELLFLPAGIKLVMIMVAGWRGALGCGLALCWISASIWPELDAAWLMAYAALSAGLTWAVVSALLRRKALGPCLEGLSFWDIVQIDAANTLLHGIVINGFLWSLGLRGGEQVWPSALAMALGDFLGSGVVMLLVLLVGQVVLPMRIQR
jgi:hypothetical protein